MKKTRRILTMLSTVVTVMVCSVPVVYASEGITEQTEEITEICSDNKITVPETIVDMVNKFIESEEIPSAYAAITPYDTDESVMIFMRGDVINNRFQKLIYGFMNENNIDSSDILTFSGALHYTYWFRDITEDDVVNVRDCSFIAKALANKDELSSRADYNVDDVVDVRDAAALAKSLAEAGMGYVTF